MFPLLCLHQELAANYFLEELTYSKQIPFNGDRLSKAEWNNKYHRKRELTGLVKWKSILPGSERFGDKVKISKPWKVLSISQIMLFCVLRVFHVFKMQSRCFLILLMILWSRWALSQLYRWAERSTKRWNSLAQTTVWINGRTRNRIEKCLGVHACAETTQPHCSQCKKWKWIFNIPVSEGRLWILEKLNIYFIMYDFISP